MLTQHDNLQGVDLTTQISYEISYIGSIEDPWIKDLSLEVCISSNKTGVEEHKQI